MLGNRLDTAFAPRVDFVHCPGASCGERCTHSPGYCAIRCICHRLYGFDDPVEASAQTTKVPVGFIRYTQDRASGTRSYPSSPKNTGDSLAAIPLVSQGRSLRTSTLTSIVVPLESEKTQLGQPLDLNVDVIIASMGD